jgi:hypothetical protein
MAVWIAERQLCVRVSSIKSCKTHGEQISSALLYESNKSTMLRTFGFMPNRRHSYPRSPCRYGYQSAEVSGVLPRAFTVSHSAGSQSQNTPKTQADLLHPGRMSQRRPFEMGFVGMMLFYVIIIERIALLQVGLLLPITRSAHHF